MHCVAMHIFNVCIFICINMIFNQNSVLSTGYFWPLYQNVWTQRLHAVQTDTTDFMISLQDPVWSVDLHQDRKWNLINWSRLMVRLTNSKPGFSIEASGLFNLSDLIGFPHHPPLSDSQRSKSFGHSAPHPRKNIPPSPCGEKEVRLKGCKCDGCYCVLLDVSTQWTVVFGFDFTCILERALHNSRKRQKH